MKNFYTDSSFLSYDLQYKYKEFSFASMDEKGKNTSFEMTAFENAYLVGLLKKYKPAKILEVGLAAGATTRMLVDFVSEQEDCTLFSCDLNEYYYRDQSKKTAYLALDQYVPPANETDSDKKKWHLLTGKYLPQYLDYIGGGIDFCILDTVHSLPGELLDFISVMPFLKEGAVVVLHDVNMPLIWKDMPRRHAHSNKVILDSVVGEKIICKDPNNFGGISNISAVVINKDTLKYFNNVFSTLSFGWSYLPGEEEIEIYANHYEKFYGASAAEHLRNIYIMQKEMLKNDEYTESSKKPKKSFMDKIKNIFK